MYVCMLALVSLQSSLAWAHPLVVRDSLAPAVKEKLVFQLAGTGSPLRGVPAPLSTLPYACLDTPSRAGGPMPNEFSPY